ncbi:Aquaporin-2 [Cytospora mali]|uniref:Aquaporin-2 n=1 Tax=Cytospora mali TaxID=578113 RepID=A0A194UW26_CYTMA|nr:Aquaporin-2 [Valsa mali var. pyri (nom. inval.)]
MPPRSPWNRSQNAGPDSNEEALLSRPLGSRFSVPIRAHIGAVVSEFVGTFLFLLFALGGTHVINSATYSDPTQAGKADATKLLYISLVFGLSLAVNVWAFQRIEGGLFNPAVAVAMFVTGTINIIRLGLVIIAQLLASIAASGLIVGLLPGNGIAATTSLGGNTSVVRGLFIEMFLTAQLVFVIFMLAIEKHQATAVAPIVIGLALFIAEMMGVYYTGGSLNPARSFGPAVVSRGGFDSYHWIYWLGPILGALLAAAFYKLIKVMQFDQITPDIMAPAPKLPVAAPAHNHIAGHDGEA